MKHTAKLQAFGRRGVASPPALSWNMPLAQAFAQARAFIIAQPTTRPLTFVQTPPPPPPSPVQRLRCCDPDYEKNWRSKKGRGGDKSAPGVMLDHSLVYPAALSSLGAWSPSPAAAGNYLEAVANPFADQRPGLAYTQGLPDTFAALTGPEVPEDTGYALKVSLYRPSGEQKVPVWSACWGDVAQGTGWALRVVDGRADLVRLSRAWTQAKEQQLWLYLEIAATEAASQAQKDAAKAQAESIEQEIYAVQHSLDGDSEIYGRWLEIVVLPEGHNFSVWLNGQRSEIEAGGQGGSNGNEPPPDADAPLLWGASPLTLSTNGGFFSWRMGYPEHSTTGELRLGSILGFYESAEELPLADIDSLFSALLPTGTSLTLERRPVLDALGAATERVELVAVFSTSNRRISPVGYLCAVVLKGGPCDGSTELYKELSTLGSEVSPDNVILGVVPQFDGDGRRRQFQVEAADVSGSTFQGDNYELLENRMCTLYQDEQASLTFGIITAVRWSDVAAGTPNTVRQSVTRPATKVTLTVCDGWTFLEERRTRDEVGDTRYRGEYLRLMLGNCGFAAWQLAGIPVQAGGRLKKARPGTGWRIRPSRSQTYADWLKTFLKNHCPGWMLFQDRLGVWQFQMRSYAVVAEFTSDSEAHNADTYPGRYAMLREIEWTRDASNFYNVLPASGGAAADGEPITRAWTIHESIKHPTGSTPKNFLGRVREADMIEDEGWETAAEVNAHLYFAAAEQGLPRFGNFPTYFHTLGAGGHDFAPGEIILCDGLKCKIVRIPDGSSANDTSAIGVQEMEQELE